MRSALTAPALLAVLAACGGSHGTALNTVGSAAQISGPRVIEVVASRWAYEPETITLQRGVPVILELRSADVHHGFSVPGLGLHADVLPDRAARVTVTARSTGVFPFHCDYFCGSGHEEMTGQIVVE